jgi:hypothetical protein
MSIEQLIKKWEKNYENILNPESMSWEDLGFEEKPKEYSSPNDFLEREGDFDEGQLASFELIRKFIEDLKGIK